MATILVVDDHPTNREFLVTLLGYRGHHLLQAADGAEALAVARAEPPDLIISDILMPTMDGYEFVRQLRTNPMLGHLPVIFSTAHYLDHEASALAQQCGVSFILPKPADPETVLGMVDAALGLTSSSITPAVEEVFDREHLRLMTNQLVHKAAELQGMNDKLTALLDLGRHLGSERDLQHLLDAHCRGARTIIGATWTALGILSEDQATLRYLFVSGLDERMRPSVGALNAEQGVLGVVVREHRPCRLQSVDGEPHLVGLPPDLPPVYSFLSVPIGYQRQVYGWLCLSNKLGSDAFSAVDERVASTLAGGIAHDFNNILGIILGYAELTLMDVPPDSVVHARVLKALHAGQRARDLVRQILTFSRRSEQQRQPLHLPAIIEEALMLLRATLPATIDIRPQIETTVGAVLADPTQMHQVLMNLCTNAAHAMRETGGLEVRFEQLEVTAAWPIPHPPLAQGPYACLTIHDTGHGMERETLEHIFEPFFTTKAVGEGTGLGLAVVHGIVTNHGGAITVQSAPGAGTTFAIYLPCVDDAPAEGSREGVVVEGHERILFVDDEDALARWGQLTLELLGYRVVACTSGPEALEVFRDAPQAFNLLITDQTMPGMTGDVLAREMWQIRRDLPIILCTGTSLTMTSVKAERLGIRAYLVKPVMKQDLSRAIRHVLDH